MNPSTPQTPHSKYGRKDIAIEILSYADARERRHHQVPFDFAVQILDLDERTQEFPRIAHSYLRMRFDDEDDPANPLGPDEATIQKIIDYAKLIPEGATVGFHCYAGRSRSAAAAVITLAVLGFSPEEAATKVEKAKPDASPNTLMLAMAGRLLDLGENLMTATQHMRDKWDAKNF